MTAQCPDCGAATTEAPWCGACGARLEGSTPAAGASDRAPLGRSRTLGVLVAVTAFTVLGAALVLQAVVEPDGATGRSDTVPTDLGQDVVVPAVTPRAASRIHPQFSAEGTVVWERTDLPPTAAGERALGAVGDTVVVLAAGEPVLTVDFASGQDAAAVTVPQPHPLTFPGGGGTTVEAVGDGLRGIADGTEVWTIALPAPLTAPPARSGPTVVVALTNGTVTAIDPVRGEVRWQRDLDVLPTAVAGDGTLLLVGTADGHVLRLDPDGRVVTTAKVGDGAVVALVADRPAAVLLADRLVGLDLTG